MARCQPQSLSSKALRWSLTDKMSQKRIAAESSLIAARDLWAGEIVPIF